MLTEERQWPTFRAYRTSCSTAGRRRGRSTPSLVVGRPGLGALLKYELTLLVSQAVPGALGLALRKLLYPRLLGACGRNVVFGQNVVLRHPHKIRIGDDVVIDDNCLLDAKGEDNRGITIGTGVFIGRNTILSCKNGDIELGRRRQHRVQLRDLLGQPRHDRRATRCSPRTATSSAATTTSATPTRAVSEQGRHSPGVRIGEGVWMGAGAKVMDGVTIGDHAIVGAGAVRDGGRARVRVAVAVGVAAREDRRDAGTRNEPHPRRHLGPVRSASGGPPRDRPGARAGAARRRATRPRCACTPQNRFGRQAPAYLATWLTDVGHGAGRRAGRPGDQLPLSELRRAAPGARLLAEPPDAGVLRPLGRVPRDADARPSSVKERRPAAADSRADRGCSRGTSRGCSRSRGRSRRGSQRLGGIPSEVLYPPPPPAAVPLRRLRRLHLRRLAADEAEAARPAGAGAGAAGGGRRPLRHRRRRRDAGRARGARAILGARGARAAGRRRWTRRSSSSTSRAAARCASRPTTRTTGS